MGAIVHTLKLFSPALGSRITILESVATYRPMSISPPSRQTLSGRRSSPKVPRFATTGNHKQGNMAYMSVSSYNIAWTRLFGTKQLPSGG